LTFFVSDHIPLSALNSKFGVTPISSDEALEQLTKVPCKPSWEYNKFGHVTVTHCDCSDTYLQVDTDVEAFFDDLGINPKTLSDGDHDELKDDPYFEGDCKRVLQDFIHIIPGDKEAIEEIMIQLTGKTEVPEQNMMKDPPQVISAYENVIYVAQKTPGLLNWYKVQGEGSGV